MHIDTIIEEAFTSHFFPCQRLCHIHYIKCVSSGLHSKRRNSRTDTGRRIGTWNKEEMYKILATWRSRCFKKWKNIKIEGKQALCAKDTNHCAQKNLFAPLLDSLYMGGDYTADVIAVPWWLTHWLSHTTFADTSPSIQHSLSVSEDFKWRFTFRSMMKQIGAVFFSIICVKYCHRDRKITLIMK